MSEFTIIPSYVHKSAKKLDKLAKELENVIIRLKDSIIEPEDYEHIAHIVDMIRSEVVELTSLRLRTRVSRRRGDENVSTDVSDVFNVIRNVIKHAGDVKYMCYNVNRDRSRFIKTALDLVSEIYVLVSLINLYSMGSMPEDKKPVKVMSPPVSPLAQQVYAFISLKGSCRLNEVYLRFNNVSRDDVDEALEELERYGFVKKAGIDPVSFDVLLSVY